MFYTKTTIGNTTIETEINDETVFTRCPLCGKEIPIDLDEHFAAGNFELCSTTIFCSSCTERAKREGKDLLELLSERFPEEVYN